MSEWVGGWVISFRISFRWEKAAAGYFISFQVSFRLVPVTPLNEKKVSAGS